MTKRFGVSALLIAASLVTACGKSSDLNKSSALKEAFDDNNLPSNFDPSYNTTFAELPTEGALDHKPWADTYWPSYQGGASNRWYDASWLKTPLDSYAYMFIKNPANLARLSDAARARLSPAEKFDIINGHFDYPTAFAERSRTKPFDRTWEGLCHGWAPSALMFQEPKPVVIEGPNGLKIPFAAGDIKALLALAVGEAETDTRFIGSRCEENLGKNPNAAKLPECRDVNAGAFHLALANEIGLRKSSFVADVTRDVEVWNQPVYGFRSTVLKEYDVTRPEAGVAPGTKREAVVETEMEYTVETGPMWESIGDESPTDTKVYKYILEMDGAGKVIGGRWLSEDRPDFLWKMAKPKFEGRFAGLDKIYEASIKAAQPAPRPAKPSAAQQLIDLLYMPLR